MQLVSHAYLSAVELLSYNVVLYKSELIQTEHFIDNCTLSFIESWFIKKYDVLPTDSCRRTQTGGNGAEISIHCERRPTMQYHLSFWYNCMLWDIEALLTNLIAPLNRQAINNPDTPG